MSSLRNAVKRITHKERSQPVSRQKLGILEKKKDYKERARDYHRKQDRIKAMKERASFRNPDEFYFAMNKSHMDSSKGRHIDERQYETLDNEAIALMKSQDLSYIRMQKQKDVRQVEKLQSNLHFLGNDDDDDDDYVDDDKKPSPKHTIFVQNQHQANNFNVAKHFDTLPELADRSFNRLRTKDIEKWTKSKYKHLISNNDDDNGRDEEEDGDDHDGYDEEEEQGDDEYANNSSKKVSAKALNKQRQQFYGQLKAERKQAKQLARERDSAYGELNERKKRARRLEHAEAHLVTERLVAGKGRKRKIKAASNGQPAQYKWRRRRQG